MVFTVRDVAGEGVQQAVSVQRSCDCIWESLCAREELRAGLSPAGEALEGLWRGQAWACISHCQGHQLCSLPRQCPLMCPALKQAQSQEGIK